MLGRRYFSLVPGVKSIPFTVAKPTINGNEICLIITVTNYPAPVGEIQQSSPTAEALGLGGLTRPLRIRCYNCGQMGHISYDCQSPQVRKTCFSCGNAGHLSRDWYNVVG